MNKPAEKANVLGIPISLHGVGSIQDLYGNKHANSSLIVTFVNPYACALAVQHIDYVEMLNTFDVVACDGIGMVKAARSIGLNQVRRESFDYTSLAEVVFRKAIEDQQRIGLVGGKPGVTDRAAKALKERFPDLEITACFSGYGQDPVGARAFFIENQLDLVICGMGAPLQERFLIQLSEDGWHGVGFTCGGFFDQISAGEHYYPKWIDHLNLRFLYRLGKEPRRLWRRYLIDYQVFLQRYFQLHWKIVKSRMGFVHSPGKSE